MYDRLIMNWNLFLWLLCLSAAICRGNQVSFFSEIPDSAGREDDYRGYKTVANPDNCKEFCRTYGWCVAAEFDYNTYGCFLYNGDTEISYKKGSVFMKQRYTEVTTIQPTTTTATSSSTTVGSSTATTTTKGPSRTDDRHTTRQRSTKSTFTEDASLSTTEETRSNTPPTSVDFTPPQTTSSLGLFPANRDAINLYSGQSAPTPLNLVDSVMVPTDVDQFVPKNAPFRRTARKPQLCFNILKFKYVTLPGKAFLMLSCDRGKRSFLPVRSTTHVVCFHVSHGGTNGNDSVLLVGKRRCEIPQHITISTRLHGELSKNTAAQDVTDVSSLHSKPTM